MHSLLSLRRLIIWLTIRQNQFLELLVRDPHANVPADHTRKRRYESFVESSWTFLHQHPHRAVDSAAVVPHWSVHKASFNDVDRRCDDSCAESGRHRRRKVARNAVLQDLTADDEFFEYVVAHDLSHVDDGVPAHVRQSTCNISTNPS